LESQRSEQLTFGDAEYDSTRPRMSMRGQIANVLRGHNHRKAAA
jgi:hypothetical protein